ncbi:MAG: epoxyqueuosine reductase QueH, partial [Anaerococcus hydrogenalis]|nr:epoxyqueuosine reductase QueH [Anaerococcus hydrogenalis]
IIECLMQHDIRPTIYYCNPNIYPLEEYNIRKNECSRYAQSLGLNIIDADYNHEAWRCTVQGLEGEPERGGRCLQCFKMRLLDTARYAHENGFSVIRDFIGHGIGKEMHEDPQVPHYGKKGFGPRIEENMVFTIEPMIALGDWKSKMDSNGWTARTKDGSVCSQFEHQLVIRKDGAEIITDQNNFSLTEEDKKFIEEYK